MTGPTQDPVRLVHVMTIPMSLVLFRGQLAYLSERGYDVRVISSPGPLLEPFARREGVTWDAVPMARRITPLRDVMAVARLYRVLRRIRPQIVHSHTPKGGLLGMVAAWLARVPVRIYHMRGLPFETARGPRRWLLRATERLSCGLAHRVLAISRSLRDVAIREGVCTPGRIGVLASGSSNGVDAAGAFNPDRLDPATRRRAREELGIPADARVVGFVGRLAREKGVVELAEAFDRLKGEMADLHLLLVGPADERDPVPAACLDRLRADDRVRLTGESWETPPLYAAMDVLALPTYREGFGNVLLEAAAMRLPVVSTAVAGVVDAVEDSVTGRLVPAGDTGALADALRAYLASEELRQLHGTAGRARVLDWFRPEGVWEALAGEYEALLDHTSGTNPRDPGFHGGSP